MKPTVENPGKIFKAVKARHPANRGKQSAVIRCYAKIRCGKQRLNILINQVFRNAGTRKTSAAGHEAHGGKSGKDF